MPKAFSLRRRWAALAARMRCRLRSSRYHYYIKTTPLLRLHLISQLSLTASPPRGSLLVGRIFRQLPITASNFFTQQMPVDPSSLTQSAFTSHTGSLLLSSPKKVTSPSFPFVLRRCHIVRASRPSAVGFRQYPLRYTVLITSLPSLARRRCTCTSTVRVS